VARGLHRRATCGPPPVVVTPSLMPTIPAKSTPKLDRIYTVRLDDVEADLLEARAAAERRPVAQFLRNLIHDALAAAKKVIR